jgi:2-polyprenyl-3-methyl-5-hydroxy-6-metoxy-1,4-benzoquinol methylase
VLPIAPRSIPILSRLEPISNSRSAGDADRNLSLSTLLMLEDAEFVEAAYLRILNRHPDEDGRINYLRLLRGGMPKIRILGALRQSSEGRTLGANVPGLHQRLFFSRLERIPILRLLITPLIEIVQSASIQRQQRVAVGKLFSDMELIRRDSTRAFSLVDGSFSEFGTCLADLITFSAELTGSLDRTKQMVESLRVGIEDSVTRGELASKLDSLEPIFQGFRDYLAQRLDLLNSKLNEQVAIHQAKQQEVTLAVGQLTELIDTRFESVAREKLSKLEFDSAMSEASSKTKEAIREVVQPLGAQSLDLRRTLLDQERRLGMFLEEAQRRLPAPFTKEQVESLLSVGNHHLDAMYANFEDHFRGTRADIRNRQRIYLPLVREACAGMPGAEVLDFGCGRGEWLETLRDEGIRARGIDVNHVFLERCKEIDLEVVEADVVEHLRSLKPASVAAVTSFHLIEHLSPDKVIAMLDETLRVLRPGGVAIFETPNPENVFVGSCTFYLDPTHRKPLPPSLAKYLLEARGFCHIDLLYLHPSEASAHVAGVDRAVSDFLNKHFFGPQDYAVIGKKDVDN